MTEVEKLRTALNYYASQVTDYQVAKEALGDKRAIDMRDKLSEILDHYDTELARQFPQSERNIARIKEERLNAVQHLLGEGVMKKGCE